MLWASKSDETHALSTNEHFFGLREQTSSQPLVPCLTYSVAGAGNPIFHRSTACTTHHTSPGLTSHLQLIIICQRDLATTSCVISTLWLCSTNFKFHNRTSILINHSPISPCKWLAVSIDISKIGVSNCTTGVSLVILLFLEIWDICIQVVFELRIYSRPTFHLRRHQYHLAAGLCVPHTS